MENMAKIFGHFAQLFGERWKNEALQPTGEPTDELLAWAEQIEGLSTRQLAQGWKSVKDRFQDRLLNDKPNFPPSEIEFKILCVGSWEHNTEAYREDDPSKLLADFSDHPELKAKADKARIKAMEIIRGESNE